MCGIVGLVTADGPADEREKIVGRMVTALSHRGPDAQAVVSIGQATFGVDRLAIVDRAGARQPMSLSFGTQQSLIAYNGEVYNFQTLRTQYEALGLRLSTCSDTETVLGAHLALGVNAVEQLDGMYAYAIWQEPQGQLVMVRDRLGIKPLFYVDLGDALIFASEPKALFCHPSITRRPNLTAIVEYFLHGAAFASGYATADRSFFEGVIALPPGHLLTWSPQQGVTTRRYWSPVDEMHTLRTNESEAQDEIAETMTESVRSMLMGEVPIGTALSGGIDSSWITLETAHAMSEPLISACITYRANADDPDAHHAALLSRKLNQENPGSHLLQYTYLPEETYLDTVDEMVTAFDEPHWEPRQLAMFENYRTLSRARRTVVLTGEGADELFFGYYRKFPGFRSPVISKPADFADLWRERLPQVRSLLSPAFASGLVSDRLAYSLIDNAVSSYLAPAWEATGDRLRAVQVWYLHTFLPWLLMDNDRCSMAHSIEGRFPFLSRKMVSLGLQLPPAWNIAKDAVMQEKVLFRRAAAGALPIEIWRDRAKSPLPVPHKSSYHEAIARRLSQEIETAHKDVWEILDRQHVLRRIEDFKVRRQSVGTNSGEFLTAYIAMGDEPLVRTAELFAILTFIRWYHLFILEPQRDSLCQPSQDYEPKPVTRSQCQNNG